MLVHTVFFGGKDGGEEDDEATGRKKGESRGSKVKERGGSGHGNVTVRSLEKKAAFINASTLPQHGGMATSPL